MMKTFLATASFTASLALALLLVPGGGTGTAIAETVCTNAGATAWVKDAKNRPDLVLSTEADQTAFHEAYFGRKPTKAYGEVRFYTHVNETFVVVAILDKSGCVIGRSQLSRDKYESTKQVYKKGLVS